MDSSKRSFWERSGIKCLFKGHKEVQYWHCYNVENPGPCDFIICWTCVQILRNGPNSLEFEKQKNENE